MHVYRWMTVVNLMKIHFCLKLQFTVSGHLIIIQNKNIIGKPAVYTTAGFPYSSSPCLTSERESPVTTVKIYLLDKTDLDAKI